MKWLDFFKSELLFKGIVNDYRELIQIKESVPSFYGVRYEEQTTIVEKAEKELDELHEKIKSIVDEKLSEKITDLIMRELYDTLSETKSGGEKQ